MNFHWETPGRRYFLSFKRYSLWVIYQRWNSAETSSDDAISFPNPRVFFGVVYTLVPDADQVAENLKVSRFDCGALTNKTLYALNQIRQCQITPVELEISQSKIILYTKHFRKALIATNCGKQPHCEKWNCGHDDHSSLDHTFPGSTSDLVISPK